MAGEMRAFDVIVVGAGVVGLSVAAALAPERRVAVIEREATLCYHATGRSSAMFAPNYGNACVRALSAASADFYHDPPAPFSRWLLTPRDILHVAEKRQKDRLAQLVGVAAKGAVFERLSATAARRYWPELRPRFTEALLEKRVGDIEIDGLIHGFRAQIKAAGGMIFPGVGDTAIERQGSSWRLATRRAVFEAPIIVNAAGAWADDVARGAGVKPCGLAPLRRTIVLVDPPPDLAFRTRPTVFDIDQGFYVRPFAGSVLVTPCDETPCCPCDAAPTEMDVARAVKACTTALDYPVRRIVARWAGLRTFAPDRAPVLGEARDAPGFYWAAGLGGAGIQTAPAVGELMAGLILSGRTPSRLTKFGVRAECYAPGRLALKRRTSA